MHKYKELTVWKKAMDLVAEIYLETVTFPDKERFNLISQINRAAVSIPSNTAEGAGRNSDEEFRHSLSIAHGSSYKLETQLILSHKLQYVEEDKSNELLASIEEFQKIIGGTSLV